MFNMRFKREEDHTRSRKMAMGSVNRNPRRPIEKAMAVAEYDGEEGVTIKDSFSKWFKPIGKN